MTNEEGIDAMFTFETGERPSAEEPVFKILVLGDWSGLTDSGNLSARSPIFIDRDDFDDVMKRVSPSVEVNVSDSEGGTMRIEFSSLDDFHPDGLFNRLPAFDELRTLRKRLRDPEEFNSAAAEVRGWTSGSSPHGITTVKSELIAEGSDSLLDDILASSSSASRGSVGGESSLRNLIRDLVAPYIVKVDEDEQAQMLAAVDSAVSDLMRRILHSKGFQKLESSWRGMHRLIRKVPTDTELKIYLFQIKKEELCADLRNHEELSRSNIFRILHDEEMGAPWAAVCGEYSFDIAVDDVATLIRMAKISADARSPFISHVDVKNFCAVDDRSERVEEIGFGGDERAEKLWTVLRADDAASSLGILSPRFLGRLPYGKDCDVVESFGFEEFNDSPDHSEYLWVNPSFLFATLIGQAYAEYGWNFYAALQHDVTDLPLHVFKQDGQTVIKPCSEFLMTETSSEALTELGLMPVVSFKDSDRVKIVNLKSLSGSSKKLNARWR